MILHVLPINFSLDRGRDCVYFATTTSPMSNPSYGPWLAIKDCGLSEQMIGLGIEVGAEFEHETCPVSFQQCDQC